MNTNQPSQHDQDFALLVLAYMDGTIAEQDGERLNELLLLDADKRTQFYCMQIRETQIRDWLNQEQAHPGDLLKDTRLHSLDCFAQTRSRWRLWGTYVAAIILIMLALWSYQLLAPLPAVRVTYSHMAAWGNPDNQPNTGQALALGKYSLLTGRVRLETQHNAVLSLEGPAQFELIDVNTMRLDYGRLSARINGAQNQYRVLTRSAEVTDLGTAFGVNVGPTGPTRVCVFEGKVQMQATTDPMGEDIFLVEEGFAAQADANGLLQNVTYDASGYEQLWPLTNGVNEMDGLVRFLPPGPIQPLSHYQDNTRLFLMPEKQQVALDKWLRVDLKRPGRYEQFSNVPRVGISKKMRVSSYLFFFNTQGPKTLEHNHMLTGVITFAKPIIGLITSNHRLNETDAMFALPGAKLTEMNARGLEDLELDSGKGNTGDLLHISKDRRSIHFKLNVDLAVDQFRVLIAD